MNRRAFIGGGLAAILSSRQSPAICIALRNGLLAARKAAPAWTNPYVTDGLVAMWDGEWNAGGGVHDASATTWVDLSGNGYDAELYTGNDPLWDSKSLYNDSSTLRDFVADNPIYGSEAYTFEAVISTTPFSGNNFAVTMRETGYLQISSGRLTTNITYYPTVPESAPDNETRSLSAAVYSTSGKTYWQSYVNGIANSPVTLNNAAQLYRPGTQCAKVYLGSAGAFNRAISMYGHVYCVRIYSRALAVAEIAANCVIDKARFNLP